MTYTLTNHQRKVLNHMKEGSILQTNEGANYKAWLLHKDQNKLSVRTDTANILFREGFIRPIENNSRYFDYEYTGKRF